ncbi:hypothetical protein E3G39_005059 [Mycobacteroides abscessus]|nr:hypothetical protein [Mycobacteroides abscessus]
MTFTQSSVSLDDAQRMIAAGRAKAEEVSSPSNTSPSSTRGAT